LKDFIFPKNQSILLGFDLFMVNFLGTLGDQIYLEEINRIECEYLYFEVKMFSIDVNTEFYSKVSFYIVEGFY